MSFPLRISTLTVLLAFAFGASGYAEYPVKRAAPKPSAPETSFTIHPDQLQQKIDGLGFEIQCDSINSGNKGMSEDISGVPHDLVPEERTRFAKEMLTGFRYCRLAGGLYWRGLDADKKQFVPRWPEQGAELRDMLHDGGVEGLLFEYWSPAPYWKANNKLIGGAWLRCFTKDFPKDPTYHGDVDAFLKDFAAACVTDLKTLKDAGVPTVMWGLQNEPFAATGYSSCTYTHDNYSKTFLAVAPAIRAYDPKIKIIADDADGSYIRPALANPAAKGLIDAFTVHHVGSDSAVVQHSHTPAGFDQPSFQDEYEYLGGPTSPDRCLNNVQHIMNWFQRGKAPTWFWIHALKPIGNSEGSGYALGFWRAPNYQGDVAPEFADLKPGHWTWNKYNWNAVAGFLKRMPWNSHAVAVDEATKSENARIFAFQRPDGKLVIVLSNRTGADHTFRINTGLGNTTFQGWRYTPDSAPDGLGEKIGTAKGPDLSPQLGDLTWEFWEQL